MVRSNSVVMVGIDNGARLPELLARLTTDGFHLVEAPSLEDLLIELACHPDAAIMVYNHAGGDTPRRVLKTLARFQRKVPVIVIVDRSDLGEYYELMSEGAFDYFDVTGDPLWIERSLQSALRDQEAYQAA